MHTSLPYGELEFRHFLEVAIQVSAFFYRFNFGANRESFFPELQARVL